MQSKGHAGEALAHIGIPSPTAALEPPSLKDEDKAAWAALLMQAFPRQERPLLVPTPTAPSAQAGAKELPQGPAAAMESQSSDTESVNPEGPSRLTLSITTETLGRIDFIVDRKGGELSLWIAASDEARTLISADPFGLARHLEGARLPVKTVNVIGRGELGTVLARSREKREGDATPDSAGAPHRPKKRRLNLIG